MALGFADDEALDSMAHLPLFVGGDRLLKEQLEYLNAYMVTGKHRKAALSSKVNRFYHWQWMQDDVAYQAAFSQIEAGIRGYDIEKIERRAVDGYFEQLSYMGKTTGDKVRKYSDTLGKAYLTAHDPKYRDGGITVNVGPQSLAITYPSGSNDLDKQGNDAAQPKITSPDK